MVNKCIWLYLVIQNQKSFSNRDCLDSWAMSLVQGQQTSWAANVFSKWFVLPFVAIVDMLSMQLENKYIHLYCYQMLVLCLDLNKNKKRKFHTMTNVRQIGCTRSLQHVINLTWQIIHLQFINKLQTYTHFVPWKFPKLFLRILVCCVCSGKLRASIVAHPYILLHVSKFLAPYKSSVCQNKSQALWWPTNDPCGGTVEAAVL